MDLKLIAEGNAPDKVYSTKKIKKKLNESCLKIKSPEDVATFFGDFFKHKRQEYFCALNVNGAGEVTSARVVTIGLLNHSLVHPREVFRDAILDNSASIICVHNHPSGSLEPSSQDIAITTQLKEAGSIIGISLIDHIILTPTGSHYSMRERGMM